MADYYRWYRQENEPLRRKQAAAQAAGFWVKELVEHSEFQIDEEERDQWIANRVDILYDAMVRAGVDPKIPRDGTDFLTEEQAKAQMKKEHEPIFTEFVAQVYLAETLSGRSVDEICREGLEKLAQEEQMTSEEIMERSGKSLVYGKFVFECVLELLSAETEQFLEE